MNYLFYFLFILLLIIIRNYRYETFKYLYKAGDDPYNTKYTSFGCVENVKLTLVFLNRNDACKELKRKTGCPDDDVDRFLKFTIGKWL